MREFIEIKGLTNKILTNLKGWALNIVRPVYMYEAKDMGRLIGLRIKWFQLLVTLKFISWWWIWGKKKKITYV